MRIFFLFKKTSFFPLYVEYVDEIFNPHPHIPHMCIIRIFRIRMANPSLDPNWLWKPMPFGEVLWYVIISNKTCWYRGHVFDSSSTLLKWLLISLFSIWERSYDVVLVGQAGHLNSCWTGTRSDLAASALEGAGEREMPTADSSLERSQNSQGWHPGLIIHLSGVLFYQSEMASALEGAGGRKMLTADWSRNLKQNDIFLYTVV